MRHHHLDAVRGLAALAVVLFHCLLVMPQAWVLANPPAPIFAQWSTQALVLAVQPVSLLWNGGLAVLLFFVLSGFVLTGSLQGRRGGYVPFAAKRIIRLLMPATVATLATALAVLLIAPEPRPDLTAWFNGHWQAISWELLARHLLLVSSGEYPLNSVLWTLEIEFYASLLFPLLLLAFAGWRRALVVMAGCVAMAALLRAGQGPALPGFLIKALVFAPLFGFGILLATYRAEAIAWLMRMSWAGWGGAWLLGYLLVVLPWLLPVPGILGIWLSGVASALLLAMVMASARMQQVLCWRPLLWLGRVSFSLYLIHVPLLLALIHLAPPLHPIVLLPAAVALSLLLAEPFHRLVERPSITLGDRVSASLGGGARRGVPEAARGSGLAWG